MTDDELWGLLSQAEDMPWGAAQIALVEQILRRVDAAGDPRLAFVTRLVATNAYVYGGEPAKAFAPFSWCVSDFDNNPQPYHQSNAHSLLWLFKTMVNGLTDFPEVPLARTYAVLDDMERRYREAGHGLQAVYKYRYVVADHVGLRDEADAWFERWQAAPRDDLSDCDGCDPTDFAEYLAGRGRYAEAVAVAEPVLSGRLDCTEQPQSILRELMVPYLLSGRADDAAAAHRRSYRLERSNLADLASIADHISFCARTGNEHRGLEILQRHLDWLATAPSPAAAMEFAAAGGHLLRRLIALGHGDAVLRRRDLPDVTAARLADELATQATELAGRFDARNGTTVQSRRIAERLAAEPFDVPVTLSPLQRPVTAAAPPAPAPEPPVEVPAEAGPTELLDLAEEHARNEREPALTATLAAFDARFPDPAVLGASVAGRRAALDGQPHWADDPEGVMASWQRAIELLTEAGATAEAAAVRGRLGVARCLTGDPAAGLPLVEQAIAGAGDDRRRAGAWTHLAVARFSQDDLAGAAEALDRAGEFAVDDRQRAAQSLWRARIEQGRDRPAEALAAASAARDFYRAHGPSARAADAAMVIGAVAADPAQIVDAYGETLTTGVPEQALISRAERGRALLALDRPAEAVVDLVEAVGLCAELDQEVPSAFIRHDLARAYQRTGRAVEAAEVAEEALLLFDRLDMPAPADDVRFLLAALYREVGDTAGALAMYRELIERLAGNPAGRGQVGEAAGGLLYDLDRDAEAAQTFAAAAADLREAGDPVGVLRLLSRRLAALHYADDVPAALETIEEGSRFAAGLPPELTQEPATVWQTAVLARESARLLLARDRHAEALPHLRGRAAALWTIGADDEAAGLDIMLGEALLGAGEAAEAEAVLAGLLDRLPAEAPARGEAEEWLARARKERGAPGE